MTNLCYPVALALVLSACASQPLYDWGQYEARLLDYYQNGELEGEFLAYQVELMQSQLSQGQRPPPGLLAETGTLFLKAGDLQQAAYYYQLEADHWPESAPLMQTLLANLEAAQ